MVFQNDCKRNFNFFRGYCYCRVIFFFIHKLNQEHMLSLSTVISDYSMRFLYNYIVRIHFCNTFLLTGSPYFKRSVVINKRCFYSSKVIKILSVPAACPVRLLSSSVLSHHLVSEDGEWPLFNGMSASLLTPSVSDFVGLP